jgi:hypothetical protein
MSGDAGEAVNPFASGPVPAHAKVFQQPTPSLTARLNHAQLAAAAMPKGTAPDTAATAAALRCEKCTWLFTHDSNAFRGEIAPPCFQLATFYAFAGLYLRVHQQAYERALSLRPHLLPTPRP